MEQPVEQPRTGFDWAIYADATFAGMSALIPLPLLDWVAEEFFRRRIPGAVARRRGQRLKPEVARLLNEGESGCLGTCLMLPVTLTVELIKRLFRKILFFLAIKQATDQVSYYWQRAFLIDYMLLRGHLDNVESAHRARQAMRQTLAATSGPMMQLAGQIVRSARHVPRMLGRARRGQEDASIQQTRASITGRWSDYEGYLHQLASRYDTAFQQQSEGPVAV